MNLSEAEREGLMAMQRSRTMAVGQVRRARLILLLDHGASREAIMNELRCDSRFITTWKTRFAGELPRLAQVYTTMARLMRPSRPGSSRKRRARAYWHRLTISPLNTSGDEHAPDRTR
jgi:hypothetical protein